MIEKALLSLALLAFAAFGFWARRDGSSNQIRGFAIGLEGRRWFPIAAGLSMTYVGGAATLNMASLGFQYGLWSLVDPFAVSFGLLIVALLIRKYRGEGTVTIADLLSGTSPGLSLLIGSVAVTVYILMLSAQFVALSKLLTPYFPLISPYLLIVVPSTLIYSYVFMGGFRSVTRTDVLQFLFILILMVLPALAIILGDLHSTDLGQQAEDFETMPMNLFILLAFSLLFVPVSQDVVFRAKAATDERSAVKGIVTGAAAYFVFVATSVWIGMSLLRSGVVLEDPETALPSFFSQHYPVLGIVPIIAVLAAVVSSLDSFSLSAIVTGSNDILKNIPGLKSLREVVLLRGTSVGVFVASLVIALWFNEILAIILVGLLLYVAILLPIALGRGLGLPNNFLLSTGLITFVAIILLEVLGMVPPLKAVVYPSAHALVVLGGYLTSNR